MKWEIDLNKDTATWDSVTLAFTADALGELDQHSVRDPEVLLWRGRIERGNRQINDERERLHMRTAAVDAYGKALRAALDPFPDDF